MNKKIFRSTLGIALFVTVLGIVLIMCVLFEFFEEQIQKELMSEASYVEHALKTQGASYIDSFNGAEKRITLIAADGTVKEDTAADEAKLDNHSDREEFIQASANGVGKSIRYSDTFMEKTVYYAKRLENGDVLRVSTTQYSVVMVLISLVQPLILVFIIAAAVSLFLSKKVSRDIMRPINSLDLNEPMNNEAYEELTPLLRKIAAQNRTIDEQISEAHKRQEEFRLITENMDEGILVIDSSTNLLTCNQAALRLLEIDKADEGSVLMLNRTKGFRNVIEKSLGGERAENHITLDERVYSIIANPVADGQTIIGAVILILDVTERVKNEQLRREFTSNVSHELKTPLTSISGFAELMKCGDIPLEDVVDFSKSIFDEAQRLITLVNDIMKISELDEGNISVERENIDLYDLSADIIKRLKQQAQKKNVRLALSGAHARITGVRRIIDEMIYNLCDNAIKYNKENGSVSVVIGEKCGGAEVVVKDTGIGIPKSSQPRVFERFYRVDKSHSREIGGTGLGLAIVKHGAIYHNADIELESAENKGTSIRIIFKAAPRD